MRPKKETRTGGRELARTGVEMVTEVMGMEELTR